MPDIRKAHVVISPLSTYERHGWYSFELVWGLVAAMQSNRYKITMRPIHKVEPTQAARNIAGKLFLEETKADWLCMVDNDMAPPLNTNFLDVLNDTGERHDIVVPMFHLWQEVSCFPAVCWETKEKRENGRCSITEEEAKELLAQKWVELDACGSGLIFIRRRVLDKMPYPWFRRIYDDDGKLIQTEDTLFTANAREHGFRVWGYTQYTVGHYRSVNLAHIPVPDRDILPADYGVKPDAKEAHA